MLNGTRQRDIPEQHSGIYERKMQEDYEERADTQGIKNMFWLKKLMLKLQWTDKQREAAAELLAVPVVSFFSGSGSPAKTHQ